MICVRCLKNNASSGIYLCGDCKDRPHFRRQKVLRTYTEVFDRLPRDRQNAILIQVHKRIQSLASYALLQELDLNILIKDYLEFEKGKTKEMRDLEMAYEKPDHTFYEGMSFTQYNPPTKEEK